MNVVYKQADDSVNAQFNLLNSNSNIIFEVDFARQKINMNKTLVVS